MRAFMNRSKLLLFGVLLWGTSLSAQAINKCVDPNGDITYTDGDCPSGSKLSDRLPLADQPKPEDVKRAQEATVRVQQKLKQNAELQAEEKAKHAQVERETTLEQQYKELLELERRKVADLEQQMRDAENVPPVIAAPPHYYQPKAPSVPSTTQSAPRSSASGGAKVELKLPAR